MRRFPFVVLAAMVFVALVLPVAASAKTWTVRNGSGATLGKVTKVSSKRCTLYDRKGRRCGKVMWNEDVIGYITYLAYPSDTGVRRQALILYMTANAGWYVADLDQATIGYCPKKSGKWVVKRASTGRVMGRVSGSCPQWAAAGAVFSLNTKWNYPF